MGIDLVLYRLRIGVYNMKSKENKMEEKFAVSGVSTWIIIQILMILLIIGGVESNPGPISQNNSSIERVEEQLNHLRNLILNMKD